MMKRRWAVVGILGAVIAALLVWWLRGGGATRERSASAANERATIALGVASTARRPDPRTLERASVEGTIRDEAGAPIPHARVCVDFESDELPTELVRAPRCTEAGDRGAYRIDGLFASEIRVAAAAKPYIPATYRPEGERHRTAFELHAGEHRTGIDLVLEKGGVELTGTVNDISGGPIAHALVRAHEGGWSTDGDYPAVETDDAGTFSLWVRPGDVAVSALAEGYAPGQESGRAPGKVAILMTPESSLSGTVVDARTAEPVGGVRVTIGDAVEITGADGTFRADRLPPGRYEVVARSPHGYGQSAGSTLVGLAQHASGVIVKLYPAVRVTGRITLPGAKPAACKDSWLRLHSSDPVRDIDADRDPDGTLRADGVLPGRYKVSVWCRGYHARDKYPPVVVAGEDVLGLEWPVDAGAIIRGHVVTKSGAPIEAASVAARSVGGAAREHTAWSGDQSAKDGGYQLTGLPPGEYELDAEAEHGVSPKDHWKVTLPSASAVVDKELVLDDGGTIRGTIVDPDGKPLAGVHVRARQVATEWEVGNSVRSADDGSFELTDLRPGDYRVTASLGRYEWSSGGLRKPGTDDDAKQGERTTVSTGHVASVRLVVEPLSGVIRGKVEDAAGNPVTDAFVSTSRESDAAGSDHANMDKLRWDADDRPVLTTTDGTFAFDKLAPGRYTLLAQRKGGGEAIAEHVAVGSTARLRMKPTASIEGTVHRDGGVPDELAIHLREATTGAARSEEFFRTAGGYAIHDLPAGHYTITYVAGGGQKQQTVDVADGEHKTGVDIELDPLVSLTGTVVELGTHKAVPGMYVMVGAGKGNNYELTSAFDDENNEYITDEAGRFTLHDAPRGVVTISGWPKDWEGGEYGFFRAVREVKGSGTVDIGEVGVLHRRTKPGDPAGELGVHFTEQAPGAAVDEHVWKVSWIDPSGPAAKTDLRVGDVVVTIDGFDVTGANASNGYLLMLAPPGTTLRIGLARGTTVAITLAPPA